ncbi:hypothetical protein HPB58_12945 [Priestia filamentosa]|uniref:hypothetical protein n=1 Tax=Priestia filamentosa TaxID=1402861 RepID=UPI001FB3AA3E|nr:hypothetical protein [Priestia filamentosa]UOE58264.1 hypothetical protein HPB58_12945 [Priestia filamentosa]
MGKSQIIDIDWEKLIVDHSYLNNSTILELTFEERRKDIEELNWLINNCIEKYNSISYLYPNSNKLSIKGFFKEEITLLKKHISLLQSIENDSFFSIFIRIKYQIRRLLKQLSGMLTSTDWLSPAVSKKGSWTEKGDYQKEEDVYMRLRGSQNLKELERVFLNEYYEYSDVYENKTKGFITCSGMKALEVALIAYKMINKRDNSPIFYQDGLYYEGITLVNSIDQGAQSLTVEEIYNKLDDSEDINCLIVDPGTTWPIRKGIEMDILMKKICKIRHTKPFFLIIDRTVTTISSQIIRDYGEKLPKNVILISIESGLKYYQLGLDLMNMGFICIHGYLLRLPSFLNTFNHLLGVLSASPEPDLCFRLPPFSLKRLENRLIRMGRNTSLLYEMFKHLQEKKDISTVRPAIQDDYGYRIGKTNWIGTLLYVQSNELRDKEDYYSAARKISSNSPNNLCIFTGSSFGFDSMRVGPVEEANTISPNNAIRFSVGREPINEILLKGRYLQQFFNKKEVLN